MDNKYKFSDLTRSSNEGMLTIFSDDNAYNFSPDRYGFYMQFLNALNDPNKLLVPSILNIVNSSKLTLQQYADRVNEIMRSLKYAVKKQSNPEEHVKKINILLRSNPLTSSYRIELASEKGASSGQNIPIRTGVTTKESGTDIQHYVKATLSPERIYIKDGKPYGIFTGIQINVDTNIPNPNCIQYKFKDAKWTEYFNITNNGTIIYNNNKIVLNDTEEIEILINYIGCGDIPPEDAVNLPKSLTLTLIKKDTGSEGEGGPEDDGFGSEGKGGPKGGPGPDSTQMVRHSSFKTVMDNYLLVGIPSDTIDPPLTHEKLERLYIPTKMFYTDFNKELVTHDIPEIEQRQERSAFKDQYDERFYKNIYNKYIEKVDKTVVGIAFNINRYNLDKDGVILYRKKEVSFAASGGKRHDLLQLGGEAITYYSKLEKELNDAEINKKDTKEIIKDYEDDPIFGLETEEITKTDRAIFIAVTYVIRAVALFLLNWSINSNMVNNFEKAFILYFVLYISLFLIIVLLVNTENNLFFRMLLYYLDTKNNGWGRIIVHILIQLGLMPVIWLLKVNTDNLKIIDFSSSQRLFNIIADYTFFIWLFSSIIVLQY